MVNIMDLYFTTFNKYAEKYGKDKLLHACQVGSFMEFYATDKEGPDLQKLSDILNMVVSKKDKSISTVDRNNPYMMGYPVISHSKFLKIMLDNGYIVVVTEQVTPPPFPKRKVTGVYTSSNCIDDNNHDNNFLMAMYIENVNKNYLIGVTLLDVSTGNIYIHETFSEKKYDGNYPLDEVVHIYKNYQPKELIICNNNVDNLNEIISYIECSESIYYNKNLKDIYKSFGEIDKIKYQKELLNKVYSHLIVASSNNKQNIFEELNIEKFTFARISLCFILNYVYENNKNVLSKINLPETIKSNDNLYLGNNVLQQLNIFKTDYTHVSIGTKFDSVFKLVNNTRTPMGSRYLKKQLCEPTFNVDELNKRYNDINNSIKHLDELDKLLHFNDIEKLTRKIELNIIHPIELNTWYENLIKSIKLLNYLNLDNTHIQTIVDKIHSIFEVNQLKKFTLNEISNKIFIHGVHKDVDKLIFNINLCNDFMDKLADKINSLLQLTPGVIKVNKNDRDGHYISMTTKRANTLKHILDKEEFIKLDDDIVISLSNLEFKIIGKGTTTKLFAPEIKNKSDKLVSLLDDIKQLNKKYFIEFLNDNIVPRIDIIKNLNKTISYWDFIYSGSYTAHKFNYCKPSIQLYDKSYIKAIDMRHPIIEQISSEIYVPTTIHIGIEGQDCILLYGLNSAGKSTLQKALGINIILAQIGYFVSCSSFVFHPYESLLARISSNDNIFKGQSSFSLEISELKSIIKRSGKNTLVIADEMCRGSEHESSLVIVMTILELLSRSKTSLITASHLHELTKTERLSTLYNVKLYHIHIDFNESTNTIIYNRELRTGSGESFYGLNVAKYLMNDSDFNDIANSVKREFNKDKLLSNQWSRYNSQLNINKCSVCDYYPKNKYEKPLEVHHIEFQRNADENGFINHMHKNHIGNLVVLCQDCHDKIDTGKLQIDGYSETNHGKILNYKLL